MELSFNGQGRQGTTARLPAAVRPYFKFGGYEGDSCTLIMEGPAEEAASADETNAPDGAAGSGKPPQSQAKASLLLSADAGSGTAPSLSQVAEALRNELGLSGNLSQ